MINYDSDDYVKSPEEWIPIPGSIEAIARLSQAGYRIAIATNQSGVGRGYFSQADLDAMHRKMLQLVEEAGGRIDAICYCPHRPEDDCDCRKPLPGLLRQIQQHLGLDIRGCYMVGDSLRDLEAGVAMGCRPVLVRTGKGQASASKLPRDELGEVWILDDLSAFADAILNP